VPQMFPFAPHERAGRHLVVGPTSSSALLVPRRRVPRRPRNSHRVGQRGQSGRRPSAVSGTPVAAPAPPRPLSGVGRRGTGPALVDYVAWRGNHGPRRQPEVPSGLPVNEGRCPAPARADPCGDSGFFRSLLPRLRHLRFFRLPKRRLRLVGTSLRISGRRGRKISRNRPSARPSSAATSFAPRARSPRSGPVALAERARPAPAGVELRRPRSRRHSSGATPMGGLGRDGPTRPLPRPPPPPFGGQVAAPFVIPLHSGRIGMVTVSHLQPSQSLAALEQVPAFTSRSAGRAPRTRTRRRRGCAGSDQTDLVGDDRNERSGSSVGPRDGVMAAPPRGVSETPEPAKVVAEEEQVGALGPTVAKPPGEV